jgi:hypothetical protein
MFLYGSKNIFLMEWLRNITCSANLKGLSFTLPVRIIQDITLETHLLRLSDSARIEGFFESAPVTNNTCLSDRQFCP